MQKKYSTISCYGLMRKIIPVFLNQGEEMFRIRGRLTCIITSIPLVLEVIADFPLILLL